MVSSLYGTNDQNNEIWVFLEQDDGILGRVSLELLSKGRRMADDIGWRLSGILLGDDVNNLKDEAFDFGADYVLLAENPLLTEFKVEAYTHVVFEAIMDRKPSIFLVGATPNGRDLAGRLAVRLKTGLNADCTDLRLDKNTGILISEVSGFGGGVLALIEMKNHRPQMATARPGVFEPIKQNTPMRGELIQIPVDLSKSLIYTNTIERVVGDSLDLTQTPVLVAGGRGINGRFDLMKDLADLLGGEVGATRPPVDEGHIERERQIGQTGVVCRPKVAICCGISGAFHFVVGVQEADIVIAINSDPDATIFNHADYCIVADVQEILPMLIDTLSSSIKIDQTKTIPSLGD